MRIGFLRIALLGLALAASSFAQAGGPPSQKATPAASSVTGTFWLDPVSHHQYFVGVRVPQAGVAAQASLLDVLPVLPTGTHTPIILPFDPMAAHPFCVLVASESDITVPAVIHPARVASATSLASGHVTEVLVEEGDQVKVGQVLARLDRRESELKLQQAQARLMRVQASFKEVEAALARRDGGVRRAEADVKRAEAQRSYAKHRLERMQELLKQQSVDQRLVDEAQAQVQAADAQLEQTKATVQVTQAGTETMHAEVAKAEVAAAHVDVQLARLHLEASDIRAPIAGRILSQHVRVGDGVTSPQGVGRSAPLLEIADLTQLDAVTDVPERDLSKLKVGQNCELRLDAFPGKAYPGKISRIAPVVSRQNRTVTVRVRLELPRDDRQVIPGLVGTLRIMTDKE